MLRTWILAAALGFAACRLHAQAPDTVIVMDTVDVRVSRLRAAGVPIGRLPYSAQVVSYERARRKSP